METRETEHLRLLREIAQNQTEGVQSRCPCCGKIATMANRSVHFNINICSVCFNEEIKSDQIDASNILSWHSYLYLDKFLKLEKKLEDLCIKQIKLKRSWAYYREHGNMNGYTGDPIVYPSDLNKNPHLYFLKNNISSILHDCNMLEMAKYGAPRSQIFCTWGMTVSFSKNKIQLAYRSPPPKAMEPILKKERFKPEGVNVFSRPDTISAMLSMEIVLDAAASLAGYPDYSGLGFLTEPPLGMFREILSENNEIERSFSAEDFIQSMFDNHPALFQTRKHALNQLFCVIGNGRKWIEGILVNPDSPCNPKNPLIEGRAYQYYPEKALYSSFSWYPISKFSIIKNVPENIREDWLALINECKSLLLQDGISV